VLYLAAVDRAHLLCYRPRHQQRKAESLGFWWQTHLMREDEGDRWGTQLERRAQL